MGYQPFYIADYDPTSGVDRSLESFIIPDKAYVDLQDCYVFRGRVKRKSGNALLGRLRRALSSVTLTNQANGGSYAVADIFADAAVALRATEPNAEIQLGSVSIVVGALTFTDNSAGALSAGGLNVGTINYVTGALSLTFDPPLGAPTNVVVTLNYYPSLPVMGLRTRELKAINDEQYIAFDTKYAYQFIAGQYQELVAGTSWQGNNSDFFWSTNYWQDGSGNDLFWATNNNQSGATSDPIRYYNGTSWTTFAPTTNGANELHQCLIMVPFKDRLCAFNTWEGGTLATATQNPQRLRFSQNGDPTDQTNGWRDDIPGRGGYIDAPTNEVIVGVEFLRDILIVKFENSSWKVVYTGNELLPFIWQKINTEFGAESTFSMVPFDQGVLSVGDVAITVNSGDSVERIDVRIPDEVFDIENDNNGPKRVQGIRNFSEEIVLWCFPKSATNSTYPNQVLVYNYRNQTYAFFNDSFTAFGYFQRTTDIVWSSLPYESWAVWDDPWNSGRLQSKFPQIIGGNQQGYVMQLFARGNSANTGRNDVSLSITAISTGASTSTLTVPNHNLQDGQLVKIVNCLGVTTLNDQILKITRVDANSFTVPSGSSGTYIGAGQVIVINNIRILTKVFAPYYATAAQGRLGFVDYLFDKTTNGQLTANVYIDEAPISSISNPNDVAIPSNTLIGTSAVYTKPEDNKPYQALQRKIWHRQFVYADAQNFQVELTLSDDQMESETIQESDVVLHAMTLFFTKTGRLTP